MKETLQDIIGWAYPLATLIVIILAALRRGLPARGWLLAHLGGVLAVMLLWRSPVLLAKLGLIDVGDFYDKLSLPLNALGLLAFCLLIPFVMGASKGRERSVAAAPGVEVRTSPLTIGEALFSFQGRMSRSDYWLKGFLPLLPLGIFNNILAYGVDSDGAQTLALLISVVSLWPSLAVLVKRLHDHNHSGWFAATLLIPFVGIAFAIFIMVEVWFLRGTVGPNRFGNDPVALDAGESLAPEVGGGAALVVEANGLADPPPAS